MHCSTTVERLSAKQALVRIVPSLVFIAALLIARLTGACSASFPELAVSALVALACAGLAVLRRALVPLAAAASPRALAACNALALVLVCALCVCAIELSWNELFFQMAPGYLCLNFALAGLVIAGLYFLGQRHAPAVWLGVLVCLLLGLAEYFVLQFKGSVILPADVLGAQTAAAVSMNYAYVIDGRALAGIMCAWTACHVALFAAPFARPDHGRRPWLRVLVNVIVAGACFWGFAALVCVPDYKDGWGIDTGDWFSKESYRTYGFVPSFISAAQNMTVEAPEGYSEEKAATLQAAYAQEHDEQAKRDTHAAARSKQFADEQPTVIAIMNESFTDFASVYGDLDAGYGGATFYNSGMDDALARGNLTVSVAGGGTCNTEFEFLTGNSLALMGAEIYPFELYSFAQCDSLVGQFDELGYTTSAIHPNLASNWHRSQVYAELGFDTFYDIDSFEGAETLRGHVTDAATYDKILELLENDASPQFIFDVTMQNHSGYDTGLIPSDRQLHYQPESFDDSQTNAELNEYLACIEESDAALEEFIGALERLDRPVVVVFFGDHQPGFGSTYNDALYPDEGEGIEHASRVFQSSYAIWANYDVVGQAQESGREDTSACYLSAKLMDLIGAPLSEYQKAQLALSEQVPLVNVYGYADARGTWHAPAYDDDVTQGYADLLLVEYAHVKEQLLDQNVF